MSLSSLPPEILRGIVTYLAADSATLSQLSRTCRSCLDICRPLLYRNIHLQEPQRTILSVAYTLFTCPELAREVRSIRTPALPVPPPIDGDDKKPTDNTHAQWPARPDLDSVLEKQVRVALEGKDAAEVESCLSAVRTGAREDLVLMLMLMNTPGLTELDIGAMGTHDNNLTRTIFRCAAPRLTKLRSVYFGQTPDDLSVEDGPRPDLTFSYSLFADLFLLPAVHEIHAFAIGPRQSEDVPEDEWDKKFDFVHDFQSNCTALRKLRVAEQLASTDVDLDYIFKRCPKLEAFEFMSLVDSGTNDMMYDWGTRWSVSSLQSILQTRADSLRKLVLPDCLFHDEATLDDERSKISLRELTNLEELRIDNVWIFDAGDMGYESGTFDQEYVDRRLVSLLPDSLQTLHIVNQEAGDKLDEMMNLTIRAVVQQRSARQGFAKLRVLSMDALEKDRLRFYLETLEKAREAGIQVSVAELPSVDE